jgi:hypothetical protein
MNEKDIYFQYNCYVHINSDDDTQQDIFDDKSDNEKEEEEGEEAKWRKDRYEREKWLQEQQVLVHTELMF